MKNYFKLILCLSLSFNSFSQAEDKTVATAPEAAAVATKSLDLRNEILSGGRYGLIYSTSASENDVLIAYRKGKLFSFKKCFSSFQGLPTEVSELRLLRYTQQDKFQNNKALQGYLKVLFQQPYCQQIGNSAIYAMENSFHRMHHDNEQSKGAFAPLGFFSGLIGLSISGTSVVVALGMWQRHYRTLSLGRFLYQERWGGKSLAFGVGLLVVSGLSASHLINTDRRREQIGAVTQSSEVARANDDQELNILSIEDSIVDFTKNFEEGLDLAIRKNKIIPF